MKCDKFCNYHCSYDCPNFAVDAFEDKYDLPASEIGLERIKCKDCQYFDKNCTCADCRKSPCKTCDHRMPNCFTSCKQYQNFHKANELRKQARIKDAQCDVNKKAIIEYVTKMERWKK